MAYEQRPNSGSLFKNERKTQETHANAQGTAQIVCPHCSAPTDFYVDAWTKRRENGVPWQSLKFKPKTGAPKVPAIMAAPAPVAAALRAPAPVDDDIPF